MAVTKPLRIAIATGGRFHVLDLARELDALGHEVRFYSVRAEGQGSEIRAAGALPCLAVAPYVAVRRMGKASAEGGARNA